MFDTRSARSVTKEADADGLPVVDDTTELVRGMGWFPGYAIDVETGQRLEIFWGENSVYNGQDLGNGFNIQNNGADMIWNPSDVLVEFPPDLPVSALNFPSGGQHFVYVTNQPYDGGVRLEGRLEARPGSPIPNRKFNAVRDITWAVFPFRIPGTQLLSYADGIIPNDVTLKLRVDSRFDFAEGEPEFNGHGAYQFSIDGKMADLEDGNDALTERWMDMINVVPNPYYGSSAYEDRTSVFDKVIKVTNLPPRAVVTIYSLDGKFIRQYNRDETPAMLRGSAERPIG
ncbi:MAG: hypothetical protein AAFU67_18155, partial [Bacteroidota bacterium]